jgi:hypothetical protein
MTIVNVSPANRYADRSRRRPAQISPSAKIPPPYTSQFGGRRLATAAPKAQPSAVPASRSIDVGHVAPNEDCMTTMVVIAAQYASGIFSSFARDREATAAIAERAECIIQSVVQTDENQRAGLDRIRRLPLGAGARARSLRSSSMHV